MPTADRHLDVVTVLAEDHAEARRLLEEAPGLSLEQRRDAFPYLVRALVGHETAEELVVYPALRRRAAGGTAVSGDRLAEQHRAEALLGDLEHLPIDAPSFEASLRQLAHAVTDHAEAEEQTVFPVLAALDEAERHRLAEQYLRAKRQAPTHAHPAAGPAPGPDPAAPLRPPLRLGGPGRQPAGGTRRPPPPGPVKLSPAVAAQAVVPRSATPTGTAGSRPAASRSSSRAAGT